jgi:hypothetical protein
MEMRSVNDPMVTRRVNEPMVTRSVNEGATVHAPSPISNRPLLRCFLTDVSGYHWVANGHDRFIGITQW